MSQILFVIASKELTEAQRKDTQRALGIVKIIYLKDLDPDYDDFIKDLPSSTDIDSIVSTAEILVSFAKSVNATHIHMQSAGILSLTVQTCIQAHEENLIVIEPVSARILRDGGWRVEHVQWRRIFNQLTKLEKISKLASKPLIREE